MAQELALAPLAGNPGSVPSTHVSRVTTAGKSRESDPHQVSTGICTHVEHTETHRPI